MIRAAISASEDLGTTGPAWRPCVGVQFAVVSPVVMLR